MKVLVVNAFVLSSSDPLRVKQDACSVSKKFKKRQQSKRKGDDFVVFCRLVAKAMEQVHVVLGYKAPVAPVCHIINATALESMVVDMSILNESSRQATLLFDSFDMIFIGSSSNRKVLPWDTKLENLARLMHMANETRKPCFTSGFCSLLEVTVASLQGSRFSPINGYRGGVLDALPIFPNYVPIQTLPCGEFTSYHYAGYLDNECGDFYVFDPTSREWRPTCNVGLRIVSESGEPTSPRFAPRDRSYAVEQRNERSVPAVNEFDREGLIFIEHRFLQHPMVKGLGPQFTLQLLPEWIINRSGHLPTARGGFQVLGESKKGPVLMAFQNKLILAASTDEGRHYGTTEKIMGNFVYATCSLMFNGSSRQNRVGSNLTTFLFGNALFGQPMEFSRATSLIPMAPAIAQRAVRSILTHGPQAVALPAGADSSSDDGPNDNGLRGPVTETDSDNVTLYGGTEQFYQSTDLALSPRATVGAIAPSPLPSSVVHSPAKSPLANRALRRSVLLDASGAGDKATRETMAAAARDVDVRLKAGGKKTATEATTTLATATTVFASTSTSPVSVPVPVSASVPLATQTTTPATATSNEIQLASISNTNPNKAPVVPTIAHFERARVATNATKATAPHHSAMSLTERLYRDREALHLPVEHPATCREPRSVFQRPIGSSTSSPIATVCFSPVRTKPFTNFRKFQKLKLQLEDKSNSAESIFECSRKDGPYLSPREREIKEEYADRQKFVHLHPTGFKLSFPTHVIPLRASGLVRGAGPYPERPANQGFEHMPASDFGILRSEDKEKHVAGYWKRF